MQKGNGFQYTVAGLQTAHGVSMNVRSDVRVPDGEAGGYCNDSRRPYRAQGNCASRRRDPLSLPYRVAIPFLMILFLIFAGMIAGRLVEKAELTTDYLKMRQHITELDASNGKMQKEVDANSSYAAISYKAQGYGLISVLGVESVKVMAPDTRPAQTQNSLTGSSPLPEGHGIISGSR